MNTCQHFHVATLTGMMCNVYLKEDILKVEHNQSKVEAKQEKLPIS